MTNKQKAYNDVVNLIFTDALNGKEYSEDKLNRMLCYSIAIHNHDKRITGLNKEWLHKESIKKTIVKEYTNESTLRMAGNIKRSFDEVNRRYN